MRIKRIHGTDMRSALERVREELGPDAVIISTRTLGTTVEERRGGLTGIEVIAGVDDQPERSAVAQARAVVQQSERAAGRESSPVAPAAARAAYALTRAANGEKTSRPSTGLPLAAVQIPSISKPAFPRVDRNGEDVPDLESLTPALEALAARRDQGLRTVAADDTAAAMTSGTVTPIRLQRTPVAADAPRMATGAEDFSQALRSAARSNTSFPLAEEPMRLSASRTDGASTDNPPFARVSRPRAPLPPRAAEPDGDDNAWPVSLRARALSFEPARPSRSASRYPIDDEDMPALAPGLRAGDDDIVFEMPRSAAHDSWADDEEGEGYLDTPAGRPRSRAALPPRLTLAEDDIEARLHAATRNPAPRSGAVSERAASPSGVAPTTPASRRVPPAPRMPELSSEPVHNHNGESYPHRPARTAALARTDHTQPSPLRAGAGGRGGEILPHSSPLDAAEAAYELLCKAGLTESVAESALEAAIGIVPAAALTRATVLAEAALARIIAGLPEAPALSAEGLRGRAVFFVGPSGAGKTSALLKAAVLLRRAGADVGIACADTMRIGTPEQMQRYGDLLRLPVALIHSADDLAATLADAPRGRVTLVDTPAAGLARAADDDDLPALIAAAPAPVVVMAIPAGASTSDLRRLAPRAQSLNTVAVAITKLDEAEAPGAALNILAGLRLPPLLVSDGRDLLGDVTTPAPAELAAAALDAALPQPAPAPSPEGWVYQGRRVDEYGEMVG